MKKNLFKKLKKRDVFRAIINIDPQNPNATTLMPIEGNVDMSELIEALGKLRDECLVKVGQASSGHPMAPVTEEKVVSKKK